MSGRVQIFAGLGFKNLLLAVAGLAGLYAIFALAWWGGKSELHYAMSNVSALGTH